MGLDMYLTKKTYVGAHYEHRKVTGDLFIKVEDRVLPIKFNRISEIIEQVGYWRKVNAIHKWFVDNVQKGVDDCGEYEVSYEKLLELKALCKKALETKDPSILPPQDGFFFGGTDINEWYWGGLQETINIIDSLDGEQSAYDSYIYRSSW
jgi:hypothetical protein